MINNDERIMILRDDEALRKAYMILLEAIISISADHESKAKMHANSALHDLRAMLFQRLGERDGYTKG